ARAPSTLPEPASPPPAESVGQAAPAPSTYGEDLVPNQFGGDQGLTTAEAYAACGPAAAVAFARTQGRNPTLQEALGIARQVGWTPEQGMAGPASEVTLLKRMGIGARMLASPTRDAIAEDVGRG